MSLNIKNPEAYRLAQAIADATGEPQLFKGNGFSHTDIEAFA